MYAHVAEDAVGILHEGTPAAWMNVLVEGNLGRRAGPELVIERGGRLNVRRVVHRPHVVIRVGLHHADGAELALLDELARGNEVGRAAPLRVDLHNPAQAAGGVHHGLAFEEGVRDRLFAVDVRPGLHGGDGRQGMPVIRRADQHHIEVLRLEHVAEVMKQLRPLLLPAGNFVRGELKILLVHIAQRHHLGSSRIHEMPQVHHAVPAGANETGPISFCIAAPDPGVARQGQAGRRRRSKEISAVHGCLPPGC